MDASRRHALATFLARQAGADSVAIVDVQLLRGRIEATWRVRAETRGGAFDGALDVVVRTGDPGSSAAGPGRAYEFAVLEMVFATGVLVPEPLWYCEDPAVIGHAFFVMRALEGVADGHRLVHDRHLGGDRTILVERLGMELARIHSIHPPQPELPLPSLEQDPALREIAALRGQLDDHGTPHPTLEWGLRWLERNARPCRELVLCHRDFRTGNYMVDERGLTGILDWEAAGWSEPWQDLGWFCAKCWRFDAHAHEAGGIGNRADFYRGYEAASGRAIDRDAVRYWELLAHVAWAVVAIQAAQRATSDPEASLSFALAGHAVSQLEYEILTMTEHA
jgi:aminoglycoside phosphotransferase (APT) family kinase protein